jgi:hypothetical protein
MFYPLTKAVLVPIIRLKTIKGDDGNWHVCMDVRFQNIGSASARNVFVNAKARSDRVYTAHRGPDWRTKPLANDGFIFEQQIHPGETVTFLSNWTHYGGYNDLADLPQSIECVFKIYAENTPALYGQVLFTQEVIRESLNQKSIERRVQFSDHFDQ